jgi:tol-pal system protein YbgF
MLSKKYVFRLLTANVLAALMITPVFAYQAPVVSGNVVAPSSEQPLIPVDSGDGNSDTSTVQQEVTATSVAAPSVDNSNNLPNQVQMLQQQVQTLQGQLEVQSHQLTQMQSQQAAQYQDLMNRINLLAQGKRSEATQALVTASGASVASTPAATAANKPATAAMAANQAGDVSSAPPAAIDANPEAPPPRAPATTAAAATAATTSAAVSPTNAASDSEQAVYQQAYNKLGKQQYSAAKTGFQAYLKQYPHGTYAGDSHYWLGELDLVTGDETSATREFTTVTQQFSSSSRVPASLLRLGSIYSAAGKTAQAKDAYNAIIRRFPSSAEASQAQQQIKALMQS